MVMSPHHVMDASRENENQQSLHYSTFMSYWLYRNGSRLPGSNNELPLYIAVSSLIVNETEYLQCWNVIILFLYISYIPYKYR